MTTAVVTQPTYLPWLGYFEAMARADVFVVLNDVQFQRRSWHSRNRLKGSNGEPFWLTVPVQGAPQQTPLAEIRVTGSAEWAPKHLRAVETALGSAPYVDEVRAIVGPILSDPPELLVELNCRLIHATATALGITPSWVRSSELQASGARSDLLVSICHEVGADAYYSAAGSRDYMTDEHDVWDRSGLQVQFQDWPHPTYAQQGSAPFVSHLAAIDAIANLGATAVGALLARPVPQVSR